MGRWISMVNQASVEEMDEWVNCQHPWRTGEPQGYLVQIQCEVSHLLVYWKYCPTHSEWAGKWLISQPLRLEPLQERKISLAFVFSVQFYRLPAWFSWRNLWHRRSCEQHLNIKTANGVYKIPLTGTGSASRIDWCNPSPKFRWGVVYPTSISNLMVGRTFFLSYPLWHQKCQLFYHLHRQPMVLCRMAYTARFSIWPNSFLSRESYLQYLRMFSHSALFAAILQQLWSKFPAPIGHRILQEWIPCEVNDCVVWSK